MMPAYKIIIETKCIQYGCTKRAKYKVFNTYNELRGHYCTQHANKYVKELNNAR
jgi:hypothetical protein